MGFFWHDSPEMESHPLIRQADLDIQGEAHTWDNSATVAASVVTLILSNRAE